MRLLTTVEQWRRRLQLEGWCFLSRRPRIWSRPLSYLRPDQDEDVRDRPQAEERPSEKGPFRRAWVNHHLWQRPWMRVRLRHPLGREARDSECGIVGVGPSRCGGCLLILACRD